MTPELYDLVLVTLLTALLWMPYILDAMVVRGIMPVLGNPRPDARPLHAWAERTKRAHANAVENLVVYSCLVLVAHVAGVHSETTVRATQIYLWARVAHVIVYAMGIPVARTLAFLAGFGAQVMLALALLG